MQKGGSYPSANCLICNCVSYDAMKVKYMEYAVEGKNSFRWPNRDDIIWYTLDNILCKTNPPKPMSHRNIGLEIEDFTKASEMKSIMN